MFTEREREYLQTARLARLATSDGAGRPHVVPVCFALVGESIVTPIDEKPQRGDPEELRRVRDVRRSDPVALIVDHYAADWSDLGWVQVRGTASVVSPGRPGHGEAVDTLRDRYEQYADHDLASRPVVRIDPGSVVSWGCLDPSVRQ